MISFDGLNQSVITGSDVLVITLFTLTTSGTFNPIAVPVLIGPVTETFTTLLVVVIGPETESEILFPAAIKQAIDWDTVNRLANENSDFSDFLKFITEDCKLGKIKSEYDKVLEIDPSNIQARDNLRILLEKLKQFKS